MEIKPLPGFKALKIFEEFDYPSLKQPKIEPARPTHWYGKYIKSLPEWWAILGLLKLKIDFSYQYSVRGGSALRGGYVVDFLIDLPPRPFPFEIWGGYWHEGQKGAGDKIREIWLSAHFNVREIQGLYQADLESQETVYAALSRELL